MSRIILIALAIVVSHCYIEGYPDWETYSRGKYGLLGSSNPYRKYVYEDNLIRIINNNANSNRPYKMAVNQFTDMTFQEFKQQKLGLMYTPPPYSNTLKSNLGFNKKQKSVNWRKKVTRVRDQGSCGSCWAFAASAAMESAYLIKDSSKYDRKTIHVSEQQQVDCVDASAGCQGGWMHYSFKHAMTYGLTDGRNSYRYTGRDQQCRTKTGDFKLTNYIYEETNCNDLLDNLRKQPVTVAVNADRWYDIGEEIFPYESNNKPRDLNHAVLLYRYKRPTRKRPECYWQIKNSWGRGWGKRGFAKLACG